MTKRSFDHLGYKNETGQPILCCDEKGYSVFCLLFPFNYQTGKCTERNSLIVSKDYANETSIKTSPVKYIIFHSILFNRPNSVITDAYDVTKTDMYYVVTAV